MTSQQLHLFNALNLAGLVIVAYFTRATARRIAGALAGGAVFSVVGLGIIAIRAVYAGSTPAVRATPSAVTPASGGDIHQRPAPGE